MKKNTVHEVVIQLVEDLPHEYINRVAELLNKELQFDSDRILHRLTSAIPQEAVRDKIRVFIKNWANLDSPPSPREMAMLTTSVAAALKYQQDKQALELIWTGPKSRYIPLRRTDQALIELISSAKQSITLVSFAVYKARNILTALETAAKRGVEIKIIVESPDSSEGKIAYDTISNLGNAIKAKAKVFVWPLTKREVAPNGKHGSLHAKVAISDSTHLYISSANLTDYAMNLNMEMGVLISSGHLPADAQKHFDELILEGVLSELNFE